MERIILNSLAGANILSIESRTFLPSNPIGFMISLPSSSIAVIVEDMSLRSSYIIQCILFARVRTRSKEFFSTFFTISSISFIVMGAHDFRIYWVVIESDINLLDENPTIASLGMDCILWLACMSDLSIVRVTERISATAPPNISFLFCRMYADHNNIGWSDSIL